MESVLENVSTPSNGRIRAGRIISGLAVLFLVFDGGIKFFDVAPVTEALARLGIPQSQAALIGALELLCTLIYVIPRTSVFGALVMTAFLGGATAIHVRAGSPFYMPVVIGIMIWIGLYLRDKELRALVPLRK
jgi:DoxX-like family